ncbi:MAG: hypothetical protein ABIQ64_00995 [Candidatus Saccharimonadales bacterium]
MIDKLLDTIAPHICCYCGQQNAILCEDCYFNIIDEPFARCIGCLSPTLTSNICNSCRNDLCLDNAWVVGDRTEALKELIDAYKFERVKQAGYSIARLLNDRLPTMPEQTTLCYVPDIALHRRQRGYDHMGEIATHLGKLRRMTVTPLLIRQTHVSQRDLTRTQRLNSQVGAFTVRKDPPSTVIVLDDIYTTGATLRAATIALKDSGVETIYGAIVARQPLDERRDL